jgi:hypothetical protein
MRLSHWVAMGVLALFVAPSAYAQNLNFPVKDFSPKNLSSALTGVNPANVTSRKVDIAGLGKAGSNSAIQTTKSRFSFSSLFPRLSGTAVTRGPLKGVNTLGGKPVSLPQPVMPVMSQVGASRASTFTGSFSGSR